MENTPKNEKPESLVEGKRRAAFETVWAELDERLSQDIPATFEVSGREYDLTGPEDCMVAYAQQLRTELAQLHEEIKQKDDYYEEKATAKLLELFQAYERMIALFAELRSYYPTAAARVVEYIPSLTECTEQAEKLWEKVRDDKK